MTTPHRIRLLLDLLAGAPLPGEGERPAGKDWDALLRLAGHHEVLPSLYASLKSRYAETCPPGVLDRARRISLRTAAMNVRRLREAAGVIQSLQKEGIETLLLKGAYLAETVYRDAALRPMMDVDLLVREEDLEAAGRALSGFGYIPEITYDRRVRHAARIVNTISYHAPERSLHVDLHLNLEPPASPFRMDPVGLWSRARPFAFEGVKCRTLSETDHLLHLCIHGAFRHLFYPLKTLFDLHLFLRRFGEEMDWESALRQAERWGAINTVRLCDGVLRSLGWAAPPAGTLASARHDDGAASGVEWAVEQILADRGAELLARRNIAQWWAAGGLRGKAKFLFKGAAWVPEGEIAGRTGRRRGARFLAARLLRLLAIAGKNLPALAGLLLHRGEIHRLAAMRRWISKG